MTDPLNTAHQRMLAAGASLRKRRCPETVEEWRLAMLAFLRIAHGYEARD